MKTPLRVSVVIPVYNAEPYLRECLDSILAQTLTDFEVVAINDGSTDRSLKILQEYAQEDTRIKIVKQKNAGPSAARNRGIKDATGKYIVFIDADDFVSPELLEKLFNQAEKTSADLVCYNFSWYYNEDKALRPNGPFDPAKLPSKQPFSHKTFVHNLFTTFPILTTTNFINKEFLDRAKIQFNTRYLRNEDVLFCFDLLMKAEKIAYLNENLYFYRIGTTTSETATNFTYPHEILRILLDIYSKIEKKYPHLYVSYANYTAAQIDGAINRQAAYPKAYRAAYDFAKNKLIGAIGLDKVPRESYEDQEFYNRIQIVLHKSFTDYILHVLDHQRRQTELFRGRSELTERRVDDLQQHIKELEAEIAYRKTLRGSARAFLGGVKRKVTHKI